MIGLMLSPIASAVRRAGASGGGGASGPSLVLTVGYVDTAGARHVDVPVIDGVTTLTGQAPFFVTFSGYGSTSTEEGATTADTGFWNIAFQIEYGEGLLGTHSNTLDPVDQDSGLPIYGHAFTVPGTHQVTLRGTKGGTSTITLNVVVTAPGAGVDMVSGDVPWFEDFTVYNAPAGGVWPDINTRIQGKRGVLIRKVGTGADPQFGNVNLDNRNEPDEVITRSANIRFWNCDIAKVECGNVGFDYCAFVGGRVRSLSLPPMEYAASEIIAQSRTARQLQNVRFVRGLLLQNTGVLNDPEWTDYVLFGEGRGLHFKNVVFEKLTTGQNTVRGVYCETSFRSCVFRNMVASSGYGKFQGWSCTNGTVPDAWRDDDTAVLEAVPEVSPRRVLGLPGRLVVMDRCVFGTAASVQPDNFIGFAPQNNVNGEPREGVELSGIQNSSAYHTTQWASLDISGRHCGARNVRLNLGAGAQITVVPNSNHINRIPTGWQGPYYEGTPPTV